MIKFNPKYLKDIIYIVAIGVLLWVVFKPKEQVNLGDIYESQIQSLQDSIAKLEIKNKQLDSLRFLYSDSVKVAYKELEKSQKKRIENIAKYEKEIKNISNLTNSDVSKFFTDRYGK
jgi:Na+/phosphate symporter